MDYFADSGVLTAVAAAIAVFSAILTVAWPYLVTDKLGDRMKQVSSERERIRARERARLEVEKSRASLKTEPKKVFKQIVQKFNLLDQTGDNTMVRKLQMAGLRGQGPIYAFLAFRMIVPLLLYLGSLFYMFVVFQGEQTFMMKLTICFAVAYAGYYAPSIYIKNQIGKRQLSIRRAWPDALDLLLICVESGMAIETALRKVSEEIGSQSLPLAEELSLTTAELSYLQDRRKAFENLGFRTGLDGVKAVMTSLIQSERYGTPIATALRVLAQENRDMRMAEAEKKAAALPPKLTVPMIVFFLPVLFVVIMTPAFIQVAETWK